MTLDKAICDALEELQLHPSNNTPRHRANFIASLAASGFAVVPVEATATHKKRGTTYDVLGSACVQSYPPLYDMDSVVVYRSHEDGVLWVRRYEEMYDGRFDMVEQEDGK